MRESLWGYWLIVLGIFVIGVLMLVNNTTSSNTQDYYLLKQVSEAAMLDAVDYAYYRATGDVKINEEKFKENFIRRFAENATFGSTYTIDFYDIYEIPPKVSVKVSSKSSLISFNGSSSSFDIVNKIDAILEIDPDYPISESDDSECISR